MTLTSKKIKCQGCGKDFNTNGGGNVCSKCIEPDWKGKCEVCGASPTQPLTGMCGPCTFGEGESADGNW